MAESLLQANVCL